MRTMNRFLLGAGVFVLLGCGARTEYFDDVDGAGGQLQGRGGTSSVAGAPHSGGTINIAGAPQVAGAPGVAGAPHTAGATGVAGAPNVAGAPGSGGRTGVAGAANIGGATSIAGAPSVAGAPSTGGSAGTPGVIEACQVIAGNSCQQCLCSTCSSQIVQCFSNFGCALILACAQQTGCSGVACYNAQTCKPVIDQFGGLTGTAMKDVLSLLTCSLGSQNSCKCN